MPALRRLLIRAYEAFNTRDVDRLGQIFHPEVEWPNILEGGTLRGHAAVIAYFHRQFALMQPDAQIIDMTPAGKDQAIVLVQYSVRDVQGRLWSDTQARLRFTFKDGMILRMEVVHGL